MRGPDESAPRVLERVRAGDLAAMAEPLEAVERLAARAHGALLGACPGPSAEDCDELDEGALAGAVRFRVAELQALRGERAALRRVDRDFVAFGLAGQSLGPFYLFRNVTGYSQRGPEGSGRETRSGNFVKLGGTGEEYTRGPIRIFHNTTRQPPSVFGSGTQGNGSIGYSTSTRIQWNVQSRNNILHVREEDSTAIYDPSRHFTNDFDYDLTNGRFNVASGHESNAIFATPVYDPSNGEREVFLDPSSRGVDEAQRIPGYNDGFEGAGPDIGAFERGAPAITHGTAADWGPWAAWVNARRFAP